MKVMSEGVGVMRVDRGGWAGMSEVRQKAWTAFFAKHDIPLDTIREFTVEYGRNPGYAQVEVVTFKQVARGDPDFDIQIHTQLQIFSLSEEEWGTIVEAR